MAPPAIGSIDQDYNVVSKRSIPVGTPAHLPKRSSDVAMSWTQAVQSGEALLRQMTLGGPQSEFRCYSDLANSGWSRFPTDGATDTDLESALTALGVTSGTYGKFRLFFYQCTHIHQSVISYGAPCNTKRMLKRFHSEYDATRRFQTSWIRH